MHEKSTYWSQKIILYFDEHFSKGAIKALKEERSWRKKVKVISVYDVNNEGREDKFQFNFCKRNGYVLVTLDDDFMNDRRYPIDGIPGIVRVVADGREGPKIAECLKVLLRFLLAFPKPKIFFGDTKFQVSLQGCIVRGRDSKTRGIKTVFLQPGDSIYKLASEFNYL